MIENIKNAKAYAKFWMGQYPRRQEVYAAMVIWTFLLYLV